MTKQELKIEFIIDGTKVQCGHQFLENIIRDIPDIEQNKKIFDILATSNNDDVREMIARKEFLSLEAIEILLKDENIEVVDNILSNRDIDKLITDEQLKMIIEKDNIKLLSTIASNVERYQNCDRCRIIKKLAKHTSSKVRYSLLNYGVSDLMTNSTLQELCEDSDIDVATEAKKELKSRME